MKKFTLQLFAASKGSTSASMSQGGSREHSESSMEGGSASHTEGGEHSFTQGGSETHSQTNTESHSTGGTHGTSLGHSYASGEIQDKTQQKYDQYSNDYVQNQKVDDAYQRLQDTINGKPTFQSNYENKLNDLYDQIMNREKFSYDFNKDAMYQMYKDRYTEQGKKAMQDTLGQAAAMTGGYNSSYGQSAAQQTYQDYLQQLNDMIPTLRNQAFNEYERAGQELLNKYGITNDAYNREYGQYRDQVSDWQSDRTFNQGLYQDERNWDYNQFTNERDYWNREYWNEKNSATTTDNENASTNWNDAYSQSNTDSYTNYWEETNREYWEDTVSSFWQNSMSDSMSSNWGMNFGMTMPMGYQGGGSVGSNTGTKKKQNADTSLLYDSTSGMFAYADPYAAQRAENEKVVNANIVDWKNQQKDNYENKVVQLENQLEELKNKMSDYEKRKLGLIK